MKRAFVAILAALAVLGTGCGGGSDPGPPDEPRPATRFAGGTSDGLLVAVDFEAFDPISLQISRALLEAPRRTALALVSRIDDGPRPAGPMQLVATTADGRMVPLVEAAVVLERIPTAEARRARRALSQSALGRTGGGALDYMVAVDVDPHAVVAVRLTAGDHVVQLAPDRR